MKTPTPLALLLVLATVPLLTICHGQNQIQELYRRPRLCTGCSESHIVISPHRNRYPRRALYAINFKRSPTAVVINEKRDLTDDIAIPGPDDLTPVSTPVSTPVVTSPIITSPTGPAVTSPAVDSSIPATSIGGTIPSEPTSVGGVTSNIVSTTVQTTAAPATTNPVSNPPAEPSTKNPPPVVTPPVATQPVVTHPTQPVTTQPVVTQPTQHTMTSGQVVSATTGSSSTLSVSISTPSFPGGNVNPSDTASNDAMSDSNRAAIMIGVIIGSIAIISCVVVWTFRKMKLSPSTQFKSKILDSSHGGTGALGSGHHDEDNETYPNIFRPPAHNSAIPRAESVISTGSSPGLQYLQCDPPNDQPQYNGQQNGHNQYGQNDTLHGSEQYNQHNTTVAIESNPFRDSASLNTGMLEAVLGHIPRSHVSFGSQDFGAHNEHYLRGLRE